MNFYNPFMSAIQYAQSIAGGMPFSQVVQPGMSFSPQFPMGDRVIPPSPRITPVTPPSVPPNIPPWYWVRVAQVSVVADLSRLGDFRGGDMGIVYDPMDVGRKAGPLPFDLGKSAGPLDFLSLLPPQQQLSKPLPDLSGGLMNTVPSDLGKVLSLI